MKCSRQLITINADHHQQRVDNFLFSYLKDVPKTRIYRMLRKGEVRINGKRSKPSNKLQQGDELRIPPVVRGSNDAPRRPPEGMLTAVAENIVFENADFLLLNKTAGMAVHGGSDVPFGVIDVLRHLRPDGSLQLVHRLDKETSGGLLIAKNRPTLLALQALLQQRAIRKSYLALVHGHWPEKQQEVSLALEKNTQAEQSKMRVAEDGQAATTLFAVEDYFTGCSLLSAELISGRTHQIRVHTAAMGHPIVADSRYGDRKRDKALPAKSPRLFLHAQRLQFQLAGKDFDFTVPLAKELQQYLSQLGE